MSPEEAMSRAMKALRLLCAALLLGNLWLSRELHFVAHDFSGFHYEANSL